MSQATRVAAYPRDLALVVQGPQAGGLLYTGALENHPALVARLAAARPLFGNSAEVLRAVRNPRRVAAAFRRAGLSCPAVASGAADVPPGGRWLCKPRKSAGGAHISVWNHCSACLRNNYLQEFIEGTPHSAVYLAAGGRAVLLGITRQLVGVGWTGADGFRYCGSIGPVQLDAAAAGEFTSIGDVLARQFALVGLFGVDAIVNAEGVWPVEVNPRYTASVEVLERVQDVPAIEWHVAACRGDGLPSPRAPVAGRTCGKAVLFAPARLVAADWSSRAERPPGQAPCLGQAQWADIPPAGSVVQPGWPIVTVIADGSGPTEVLAQLRREAEELFQALALPDAAANSG